LRLDSTCQEKRWIFFSRCRRYCSAM
jgi:hypothetical protein